MDSSPLSSLPPELRLDIFGRVLRVEGGVVVTLNKPPRKTKGTNSLNKPAGLASSSQQKNLLAISATCKKIERETADLIFAVNDKWNFVSPDDNSTAWGKRVRGWSATVDTKNSLARTKEVKLDLGLRKSRRSNTGLFNPMDIPNEAAALFLNLPRVLRQPTITHTIKMTMDWTDDVRLSRKNSVGEPLSHCIYHLPMFGTPKEINDALDGPAREQATAIEFDREWRPVWFEGNEVFVRFKYPPNYLEQYERVTLDAGSLMTAAMDIEDAMVVYAEDIGKKLFDKAEQLGW